MSELPKLYWMKGRCRNVNENAFSKVERLVHLEELDRIVSAQKEIAIKINLSEMGNDHYLPPMYLAYLYRYFKEMAAVPVITDSGSLFKGSRFSGYDWGKTILMKGLPGGDLFDNQIFQAGGYTNEEGHFFPSEGEHLGGMEIGSVALECQNILVLSHVTAHPLIGIAGAILNFGWGLLTATGKLRIHECLDIEYDEDRCDHCRICVPYCPTGAISVPEGSSKIAFDSRLCNACLGCLITCPHGAIRINPEGIPMFQECIAEAALTVKKHLLGQAFFVNFLMSVTPQTDEHPFSDVPFVPELGILASEDPVALDWATYQMIVSSPGVAGSVAEELNVLERGQDKIKAITGQTPERLIETAEELGLGTRKAEFLSAG